MKRIGAVLMAFGGLVGLTAGVWVAIGIDRGGLPWLVSVGLVKLVVVASLGLMTAGALLARAASRAEKAERLRQLELGAGAPMASSPRAQSETVRIDNANRQRRP